MPLDASSDGKIAVIGGAAQDEVVTGGGGSGQVYPYYKVTPLQVRYIVYIFPFGALYVIDNENVVI